MLQAPQRTGLSGPTLIRLLTRLTEVDAPESRQPLSDHLSQWLGWTDAIALSAALNNRPPAIAPGARQFSSAEERECERVRTTLADAIASDTAATAAKRQMPGQVSAKVAALQADDADYSNFRQRYLSLQHTMETSIGNLRSRLRGMLAAKTPEMTRLAVVDAIMDRALLPRERTLLGAIPKLLQGHFDRLRLAEQAALEAAAQAQAESEVPAGTADEPAADAPAPAAPGGSATDDAPAAAAPAQAAACAAPQPALSAPTPGAWLETFRKDMRSVLLAELDVRLQPVEGLLATLRAS
ncbi:DUF3348 domain-containing protein [Achromobacter ruhlandii]|uniref:DUF3348 domain-containing protein n=2 Tax=Achromobacter ruhlandii TaxID=72557 RepID=UPI0009F2F01D|nr:DUF3348 domain-containing protein [Achromobacter ruhlandii]MCZ8435978.1 DUF3348 domain-containing protein [Achromobacter ruhlandii]MDC6090962.1 DUF3348 domain-containing protein [Achromobacter ruhlandii]MDC6149894.1 DUF3348 domain-containing protein [Achromobacter ruhlandii]MDD7981256.1 DUF3348 domain-containing protein [Achromobacter ruhlandii]WIW00476.1 DUF3348 domain-containing protein [Achromobacter ruhlandii]